MAAPAEAVTSAPRPDPSVSALDGDNALAESHVESPASDQVRHSSPEAGESRTEKDGDHDERPALPDEEVPPLPNEAPPSATPDDGWAPVWDDNAQAFYFYNRFTGLTQWTNPRIPEVEPRAPGVDAAPGVGNYDRIPKPTAAATEPAPSRPYGGYDPAIHGDYDPTASYAQEAGGAEQEPSEGADPNAIYTATGVFNRFTGKWQPTTLTPENFNDENKSKRQMSAFFDVDAAANSHNGKSLKAERSGKKLSKQELKAFKEKRREKKEEKRRAWLRD